MGDMRVTGRYLKPVRQPLDDQLLNILNNPKMSEPAKVAALQQAIAKLSEPEKKALYERLKDKDTKDPLGRQLHYRLSHHSDKPSRLSTVDQILEALKPTPATAAHTAGSDPISQFGAPPDGEGGTATPNEVCRSGRRAHRDRAERSQGTDGPGHPAAQGASL